MNFDNERSAFGRRHVRNEQTGECDGCLEKSLAIIARAGERTPMEFICCVSFTSLLQTMIEAARGVVSGDRVQRSPVSRNDQKTGEILCLSPKSIGRGAWDSTHNRIGNLIYMRNPKVNAALENHPNLLRGFLRENPGAKTIPNSNTSNTRRRNN